MLKVLMLVNYFPPEIGSGPHLPFELGETLVQRGCQVTVMTGLSAVQFTRHTPEISWQVILSGRDGRDDHT